MSTVTATVDSQMHIPIELRAQRKHCEIFARRSRKLQQWPWAGQAAGIGRWAIAAKTDCAVGVTVRRVSATRRRCGSLLLPMQTAGTVGPWPSQRPHHGVASTAPLTTLLPVLPLPASGAGVRCADTSVRARKRTRFTCPTCLPVFFPFFRIASLWIRPPDTRGALLGSTRTRRLL